MNPLEFNLPGTIFKTRCWVKPVQPESLDTTQYEVYLNNKLSAHVFCDNNGKWQQFDGKSLSAENLKLIGFKIENFVAMMSQINRFFGATQAQSAPVYNNADSFQAAISL